MTTAHDSQQQARTPSALDVAAFVSTRPEFERVESPLILRIIEAAFERAAAIAATPQQPAPQHGGLVPQGGSAGGVTEADVERALDVYFDEPVSEFGWRDRYGGSTDSPFRVQMRAALESFAASRLDAATPAPCVDSGERCVWGEDSDGTWNTGCGEMFVFTDGGPEDNDARFCIYCGKGISAFHFTDDDDEEAVAASPSHGTGESL